MYKIDKISYILYKTTKYRVLKERFIDFYALFRSRLEVIRILDRGVVAVKRRRAGVCAVDVEVTGHFFAELSFLTVFFFHKILLILQIQIIAEPLCKAVRSSNWDYR